jgi:hypothetical protein
MDTVARLAANRFLNLTLPNPLTLNYPWKNSEDLRELTISRPGVSPSRRCRARREKLKRFQRRLPEKWLKANPESSLDCLICAIIAIVLYDVGPCEKVETRAWSKKRSWAK